MQLVSIYRIPKKQAESALYPVSHILKPTTAMESFFQKYPPPVNENDALGMITDKVATAAECCKTGIDYYKTLYDAKRMIDDFFEAKDVNVSEL